MKKRKFQVPIAVYNKVVSLGEAGYKWLENLDELIQSLEDDWKVKVGKVLDGGSEAVVAEAVDANNVDVILKVAMPRMKGNTIFENELRTLILANGNGYASVLNFDIKRRAILLEKLGVTLESKNLPIDKQMKIICEALKQTWLPLQGKEHSLEINIFKDFREFILEFYKNLQIENYERVINMAIHLCEVRELSFEVERAVLVHGDAHSGNLLQVPSLKENNEQFKFIDPDGIFCEPAFDLGVLMREWIDDLITEPIELGKKRSEYLSSLTNIESQSIWQWGYIQCVSTGLLLFRVGQKQEGLKLLKVANVWTDYFSRTTNSH